MDALDVLNVGAEVRGMVDLVVEQNAADLVAYKLRRLDVVAVQVEEVVLETPSLNGQHEIASRLHILIVDDLAPHLDAIAGHRVFRRTLLVLAIG